MTADNIKFHCSSLGYIMTEPRSKSAESLSDTAKTHCVDVFVANKYGRHTDIQNKYTAKGLMVEEDSLTLYSRRKQFFYKKNQEHIENEFIIGTPDIILTEKTDGVFLPKMVIDIKSSWDIFTFFRNANPDKLNKGYYWQLQGYMALTGAEQSILAYCLVDTPEVLINDEKRKLMWKMNVISDTDKDYAEACNEIDKLSRYSDIPLEERVIEILIPRNDADIEKMYSRVSQCRTYMNKNLFKVQEELIETL